MLNNTVNIAKVRLAKHREQGVKSRLSIHEVAQLMDSVTFGPPVQDVKSSQLFFGFSKN